MIALLFCIAALTPVEQLAQVNSLRIKAEAFENGSMPDSAANCYAEVCKNSLHANATDFLALASLKLTLKDTSGFRSAISYAIEAGGADSMLANGYVRPELQSDLAYARTYIAAAYPRSRAVFTSKVDSAMVREMEDILSLDQLVRSSRYSDSNYRHIAAIGHYIDSVNFTRVQRLIGQGRFPDFKNYGIGSARYDPVLMHITDGSEHRWTEIFGYLKQAALSGRISSAQVHGIASRHYATNSGCSYYGSLKFGKLPLCNCTQVDKYRAEIGLESLQAEGARKNSKMAECSQK